MRRNLGFAVVAVVAGLIGYWLLGGPEPSPTGGPGSNAAKPGVLSWIFGGGESAAAEGSSSAAEDAKKKPVTGVVVDAITGAPVHGATVALRKLRADVAETVSDEDGRFGFDDWYEANVILVSRPGYATFSSRLAFAKEHRIELDVAVRVSGIVVNERGDPVEGADVWVEDDERSSDWPPAESSHVQTRADGRFEIVDAPPGDLQAHAEHETFADASESIGGVGSGGVRDAVRVEMSSSATITGTVHGVTGAPAVGVEVSWRAARAYRSEESTETDASGNFTLRVSPALGTVIAVSDVHGDASLEVEASAARPESVDVTLALPAPLIGRVVDESDAPVVGATVKLSAHLSGKSRFSETVSGADGRFELRAPAGASVQVSANKDTAFGKAYRKNGEELVVRLQTLAKLEVRLVGEDGDKFSEGWSLYGKAAQGTFLEMAATADGTLLSGPPGEWTISVQVKGVGTQETKVTTSLAQQDASLDIIVKGPGALGLARGRVESQDGAPVAGAHVSLARMNGNFGALVRDGAVRSDAFGRFALPAPPGAQTLFVYHPEHRSEWMRVVMPPHGDADAGTVRLKKGRSSDAFQETVGIGVQFESDPLGPKVRFVYEETPAEKAGIRYGDVFLEADGVVLAGMPMKDVLARTQGAEGTTVRLRVQRAGGAPFDVDVVREKYRT